MKEEVKSSSIATRRLKAYNGDAPYIFISYAHADSEMVYKEISLLNEMGYHVWYDEGITPGNDWTDEVADALLRCSLFLVMITPISVERKNVQNEINYAIDENKPFLAVHLNETNLRRGVKLQIGTKQAILKYKMTEEDYFAKLQTAITNLGLEPDKIIKPEIPSTNKYEIPEKNRKEKKGRYEVVKNNDGSVYKGFLVGESREGTGSIQYSNGDIATGQFENDNFVSGLLYCHDDGTVIEGYFDEGKANGLGTQYFKDGSKQIGLFTDNHLKGAVKIINDDGTVSEDFFYDGKPVDAQTLETQDFQDPIFKVMKIEHELKEIEKLEYSFTTKSRVVSIQKLISEIVKSEEATKCLLTKKELILDGLNRCTKEYPKEAVRSGDISLYQIVEQIKEIIKTVTALKVLSNDKNDSYGWGPDRSFFDNNFFIAYPLINTKSKSFDGLSDQRCFVHIFKDGSNDNGGILELQPGSKYCVRIYFENNADASLNDNIGAAKDVKINAAFPTILKKGETGEVSSIIKSSNAYCEKVWCQRYVKSLSGKIYINHVPGSSILKFDGDSEEYPVDESLFTYDGASIGFSGAEGTIPCGDGSSGYVQFYIETKELKCSIELKASYDGVKYFNTLYARAGTSIYLKQIIKNVGTLKLNNVTLNAFLPNEISGIPNSVFLMANDSGKWDLLPDNLFTNGLNLGTIGTGNKVEIVFKCRVDKEFTKGQQAFCSSRLTYDNETKQGLSNWAYSFITGSSSAISPWGPSREVFTSEHPSPYATFNSLTNNVGLGDERNFVRVREAKVGNTFCDEVEVKAGHFYEVYIYFMNGASPSLANTEAGDAKDVRVKSSFPRIIDITKKYVITATIESSNTTPKAVWDGAYLSTDTRLKLNYVSKSARFHQRNSEFHNCLLNEDELFSKEGCLISVDSSKPGVIPSSDSQGSGFITYCIYATEIKDS